MKALMVTEAKTYLCIEQAGDTYVHSTVGSNRSTVSSVSIESCASSNIARLLLTTQIEVAVTLWPTGHGSKKKQKKKLLFVLFKCGPFDIVRPCEKLKIRHEVMRSILLLCAGSKCFRREFIKGKWMLKVLIFLSEPWFSSTHTHSHTQLHKWETHIPYCDVHVM